MYVRVGRGRAVGQDTRSCEVEGVRVVLLVVLLLMLVMLLRGRGRRGSGYLVVIFVLSFGFCIVGELFELVVDGGRGVSAGCGGGAGKGLGVPLDAGNGGGLGHLVWAATRRWTASASGTHGGLVREGHG